MIILSTRAIILRIPVLFFAPMSRKYITLAVTIKPAHFGQIFYRKAREVDTTGMGSVN